MVRSVGWGGAGVRREASAIERLKDVPLSPMQICHGTAEERNEGPKNVNGVPVRFRQQDADIARITDFGR